MQTAPKYEQERGEVSGRIPAKPHCWKMEWEREQLWRESGSYIKSHLPRIISPEFWNVPELEGVWGWKGGSTCRRVRKKVMRGDDGPGPGPGRPGRRVSRPARAKGGGGGAPRGGPGAGAGAPRSCQAAGPPPPPAAGCQRTRTAEGSPGPSAAPAGPGLSNFPLGEAGRGYRGSPPPPALEAAGGGGMVHWGSKDLTILLGGRRLAREEKSVGAQKGSRRKRRRRPSCAGLWRLRPSGRPRGRGCRLGEGRRCLGARAGRVTGHTGASGEEEKLRSRFGDRERGRRDSEKGERQRGREEGEKGKRGPGGSWGTA